MLWSPESENETLTTLAALRLAIDHNLDIAPLHAPWRFRQHDFGSTALRFFAHCYGALQLTGLGRLTGNRNKLKGSGILKAGLKRRRLCTLYVDPIGFLQTVLSRMWMMGSFPLRRDPCGRMWTLVDPCDSQVHPWISPSCRLGSHDQLVR